MLTMNETSAKRAADPVCVGIGSTLHTSAGSVAFLGLENSKEVRMDQGGLTANPIYPVKAQPAAEDLTVAPVASGFGAHAFRFMAEAARDQGYISQEGLEHVMRALYPEVDHA